jgi:hypothetical protein
MTNKSELPQTRVATTNSFPEGIVMKKPRLAGAMCNLILGLCLTPSTMASVLAPNTSYLMHIKIGSSCWLAGDCSAGFGLFTDNNDVVNFDGVDYGSSIPGDGWAGVVGFTTDATGEGFTVDSFSQDGRAVSPPDGLVFFSDTPEMMTGSVSASGDMTFIPATRMAISGAFTGSIGVQPWNFDNSSLVAAPSNDWEPLTTGTSTSQEVFGDPSSVLSLTGSPLTPDASGGWNARLVAAGNMGDDWLFFSGTPYTEIWDVHISEVSTVPLPAAVWFLGSGLLGLIGISRRKKEEHKR